MNRIILLLLLVLSAYGWSAETVDYKPNFRWVEKGTSASSKKTYDFTLYDGAEPIGYFGKQLLSFYEYKLIPGVVCGEAPGWNGISLYAQNQYWNNETLNLKEFAADTSNPGRFVLKACLGQKRKGEKDDALDIASLIEVTWDTTLKCYAWTVTKKMTILGGQVLKEPFVEFEDTFFRGMWSPSDQRYQYFVRKAPDGQYYKMPLNNDKSMDKRDWRYARDGFWFACLSNESNPAFEWLEGHTENVRTDICWYFQDLHDYWLPGKAGFQVGDTKTIRYRFVSYPYEKAAAILEASKFRDLPDDPIKDFPMREWPLSRFDKNVYRVAKLGLWPWCPSTRWDEGLPKDYDPMCIWDKTTGYDDKFSLKIDASDGGRHTWRCTAVDYSPTIPIKGKSSFTFKCKTKDLKGYARLVYQNMSPTTEPVVSEKISGTHDWTELILNVPEGYKKTGNSDLYFEVQGPGMAWMDNLLRQSEPDAKPADR